MQNYTSYTPSIYSGGGPISVNIRSEDEVTHKTSTLSRQVLQAGRQLLDLSLPSSGRAFQYCLVAFI